MAGWGKLASLVCLKPLAMNLDFADSVDIAQMIASMAGDAIPSVSILSREWYEILGISTRGIYLKKKSLLFMTQKRYQAR